MRPAGDGTHEARRNERLYCAMPNGYVRQGYYARRLMQRVRVLCGRGVLKSGIVSMKGRWGL